MNKFVAYKENVKKIIESYGGKVDTTFIPGVIEQPTALKTIHLPERPFFQPVEIHFSGSEMKIGTAYSIWNLTEAKEYLKRLEIAIEILEKIEKERI